MNYYYFFVLLQYHLAFRLCNCLQSGGVSFDFDNNMNNQSSANQYCQRFMTHTQIVALRSRKPCPSIEK
jgi:hypothetical protein